MTSDLKPVVASGLSLVGMALCAPLSAIEPGGSVVHWVTMQAIVRAHGGKVLVSACGIEVRLIGIPIEDPETGIGWPPRIAALQGSAKRCKACFDAIGKRKPHPRWDGAPLHVLGHLTKEET